MVRRLATDYVVQNGVIISKINGNKIIDDRIEALKLKTVLTRSLKDISIYFISELINITTSMLRKSKYIGTGAINEIQDKLYRYLTDVNNAIVCDNRLHHINDSHETPIDALPLTTRTRNCLKRNGISSLKQLMAVDDAVLKSFHSLGVGIYNDIMQFKENNKEFIKGIDDSYRITLQRQILKNVIKSEMNKYPLMTWTYQDLIDKFENDYAVSDLSLVLSDMVLEGSISLIDTDTYTLNKIRLNDFIDKYYRELYNYRGYYESIENGLEMLKQMFKGSKIDTIADTYSIGIDSTKRHIEKALDKVWEVADMMNVTLLEEAYRYIYEGYNLTEEMFILLTKEHIEVYRYLKYVYKHGVGTLREMLCDVGIPKSIKVNITSVLENNSTDNYVWAFKSDTVYKTRDKIVKYLSFEYCRNSMTFDKFINLYNNYIIDNDIDDIVETIETEHNANAIRKYLISCSFLLWGKNKFRYYSINTRDYTKLLNELKLDSYIDIDISTSIIYNQHIELMKEYDIKDHYELFNLLKKLKVNEQIYDMRFETPMVLCFGNFNYTEVFYNILEKYVTIRCEDFVKIIKDRYGFVGYALDKRLKCLDRYKANGVYSIMSDKIPEEHMKLLKKELTNDFYTFDEISAIYINLVGSDNAYPITYDVLKNLGFVVNKSCIIKNYSTSSDYFIDLFTKNYIVDAKEMYKKYKGVCSFYNAIHLLRQSYSIIEIEPLVFATRSYLATKGISVDDLKGYANAVYSFVDEDEVFTIDNLIKRGFNRRLHTYGFKSWFYSSILRVDRRFAVRKLGDNILIKKCSDESYSKDVTVVDFVNYLMHKEEYMILDVDDFIDKVYTNYKVKFDSEYIQLTLKTAFGGSIA